MQWSVFESSFVPLAAGDDAAALDRIGAALEVCRRSGYTAYEPFFVAHLGWVHRLAGPAGPRPARGPAAVELAERHRHTWWSTTASSLYAATLLALRGAGRGRRQSSGRPSGSPTWPARRPTCSAASAPLAEATGDPAVLRRADALLRSIRAPEGCAWLLGADAYLGVARAWRRAGQSRPGRARSSPASARPPARPAGRRWPDLGG